MNNKWKRSLALLLMLALMLTLPMATAWAADGDEGGDVVDPPAAGDGESADKIEGTLTAKVADDYAYKDDLETSDVVVDLYMIAKAVKDPNYVTYTYEVQDDFGLDDNLSTYDKLSKLTASDWDAMAQTAWDAVLGGSAPAPVVKGAALEAASNVDGGIYLVVAHGFGDDVADYAKEITTDDGKTKMVTMAQSEQYVYTFNPVMIAVPNSPNFNTDMGDWEFDVTAILKPGEREFRMTEITVNKLLTAMNISAQFAGKKATFAFSVKYEIKGDDGKMVTGSQVVSLTFENIKEPTTKSVTVGNIPVGAKVTVVEEYSGAAYQLDTAKTVTIPSAASDGSSSASFTNSPPTTPPWDAGYGIENNYEMQDGAFVFDGTDASSGGGDQK